MNDVLISLLFSFGPFVALIILGLTVGSIVQNRHIKQLDARAAALGGFILSNMKYADGSHGELVTGSTVVAYDFFRRIAVLLRKIIGGRFRMHEVMMMRARREAVLRMAEDAQARGAVSVHNIRLVTSNLGDSGSALGGCEVLAYGTAVWT